MYKRRLSNIENQPGISKFVDEESTKIKGKTEKLVNSTKSAKRTTSVQPKVQTVYLSQRSDQGSKQ